MKTAILGLLVLCACEAKSDPCTSYKPYPDVEKRSPDNPYQAANPISDQYLEEAWYGSPGRDLAKAPPDMERCGTRYPIWLKESNATAALVCIMSSANKNCKSALTVEKKTCGTFPVYKLRRTHQQNSAYCVVLQNPADIPPDYTHKPEVETDIVDNGQKSQLVFNCKFPDVAAANFYTVHWTVNDRQIKIFNTESYSDLRTNAVLTEAILKENGITKPGFEVQCGVQAHKKVDGPGSQIQSSTKKFIGIKILDEKVSVVEGQCKPVRVQLTAPFGCGADKDDCSLSTEVFDLSKPSKSCDGRTIMRKFCGTNPIQESKWNEVVSLEVCGQIGIQYGSISVTRSFGLKTELSFFSHEFWQDYDIGDITVHITRDASSIKGKRCGAVNDPHMTTFNGRRYEHHLDGVFTLYKHLHLNLEIQLQTRKCGGGYPRCNCGLAIRAGQTVFLFDHCGLREWYINYKQTQQGANLLDIRQNQKRYRVKLPTGGLVEVQINGKWLNVYFSPSVKDKEQTGGLCGKLTGCNQEMTLRNGQISSDPNAKRCGKGGYFPRFSENWRVNAANNLFRTQNGLQPWPSSELYCSCPIADRALGRVTFVDKVECSAQKTSEECLQMPGYKLTRFPNRPVIQKRKRSVGDLKTYAFFRTKRQAKEPGWRNGWTEKKAREHCQEMFNSSKCIEMCHDVPNVEMKPSEENCVADIKLMANGDFMMAALDDVRSKCVHEVMMDPEMHNETEEGKPSMLTMMMDFGVCPNECNQKGNCTNGECKCEKNYGGADCSVDLTKPPQVTELQQNDGCVLGKCNATSVYGGTFVDSDMLKCRVKQLKVFEDASVEEGDAQEVLAEAVSIAEVECQLPDISPAEGVTKTYVNGFRVSVSNIGNLYSQELDMLVLDPKCQRQVDKENSDLKWEKHGSPHCIHNGKCVAKGATKPDGTTCTIQKGNRAAILEPFRYWGVVILCIILVFSG